MSQVIDAAGNASAVAASDLANFVYALRAAQSVPTLATTATAAVVGSKLANDNITILHPGPDRAFH